MHGPPTVPPQSIHRRHPLPSYGRPPARSISRSSSSSSSSSSPRESVSHLSKSSCGVAVAGAGEWMEASLPACLLACLVDCLPALPACLSDGTLHPFRFTGRKTSVTTVRDSDTINISIYSFLDVASSLAINNTGIRGCPFREKRQIAQPKEEALQPDSSSSSKS